MEIPKTYDPASVEDKWYRHWQENGCFRSVPDGREPYTVVIPPPNVTGVLHMGHMLNNTIQDVLVRRARMLGKNACWVPGTDHASIATEARVVAMLAEKGIRKADLSREEFLKHAWEWTEKHGGIILEQLKKLGASCDWQRTRFTMEESLSEAVTAVFVDLYEKGWIYRGHRMVNWDPKAGTAVSDEEVNHKEEQSKLYYIRYGIEGEDAHVVIATTRPETMLGDTAVCIHPSDPRYSKLKGKRAVVPLVNRLVPVIGDEYVDMEFGTGALKVTPAHDANDYMLGQKHKLEIIDIFNEDGTLSGNAVLHVGEDRFAARRKIAQELEAAGCLEKVETITNKVGYSERTDAVIEPRLSLQWFCRMGEMTKPALENVLSGNIRIHPQKFVNTYRHWMENVRDWCISRQLWWGQRIPAWYYGAGMNDYVVARTADEALAKARKKSGNSALTPGDLRQDEDVVDTWFSSWLWPISVFDPKVFGAEKGYPGNADINYYYPTNDLVTAPEILFFWVARMIMCGYEYRQKKPFSNVYLTGIVRDKQGRKMSKSLGNSPEPLDLIKKHGADGVRVGMLLCSPAGNDLLFDEALCAQGSAFANKIWNAFRLVQGWEVDEKKEQPEVCRIAGEWFEAQLNHSIAKINGHFEKFRLSDALMTAYKLTWDEFCAWYLEMIKPGMGEKIDKKSHLAAINHFESLLRILHPFMPFITEELWSRIGEGSAANDKLIAALWPAAREADGFIIKTMDMTKEVVVNVRHCRRQNNISNKEAVTLYARTLTENDTYSWHFSVVKKLAHLDQEELLSAKEVLPGSFPFMAGLLEYYVPLKGSANVSGKIGNIEEELNYLRGFLASVEKKLGNENFVRNAADHIVAGERRKKADAEAKIRLLEDRLKGLAASAGD